MYDIIIIGGGVSGMIASVKASEEGARVLLIEKNNSLGRKLSITGKGRCNITNNKSMEFHFQNIYPRPRFLKYAYSVFFKDDIIFLLEKLGVKTTTERGDRVFPVSNNAKDIVNSLLHRIQNSNITIQYKTTVKQIITEDNQVKGITIFHKNKTEFISAKHVIIATGGKSYPTTGSSGDGYQLASSIGHSVITPRPALVPLETQENVVKQVQGLTLKKVTAIVWIDGKKHSEQFGEMIFTHFGLSGPIILTLSTLLANALQNNSQITISIDLKPAIDEKKLDNRLIRDLEENSKKSISNICKLWLPSKLIPVFIEYAGIDRTKNGSQITGKERRNLRNLMKSFSFQITGDRGFKEAIITAGGISTDEINAKSMESKLVNNLYFVGEIINLHGNTGGYNLQIAWSTGWLAALTCTERLKE